MCAAHSCGLGQWTGPQRDRLHHKPPVSGSAVCYRRKSRRRSGGTGWTPDSLKHTHQQITVLRPCRHTTASPPNSVRARTWKPEVFPWGLIGSGVLGQNAERQLHCASHAKSSKSDRTSARWRASIVEARCNLGNSSHSAHAARTYPRRVARPGLNVHGRSGAAPRQHPKLAHCRRKAAPCTYPTPIRDSVVAMPGRICTWCWSPGRCPCSRAASAARQLRPTAARPARFSVHLRPSMGLQRPALSGLPAPRQARLAPSSFEQLRVLRAPCPR